MPLLILSIALLDQTNQNKYIAVHAQHRYDNLYCGRVIFNLMDTYTYKSFKGPKTESLGTPQVKSAYSEVIPTLASFKATCYF